MNTTTTSFAIGADAVASVPSLTLPNDAVLSIPSLTLPNDAVHQPINSKGDQQ